MNLETNTKTTELREHYIGKSFQWTKPIDPLKLGIIVKCNDVKNSQGMTRLIFEDGSKINLEILSDHLTEVYDINNPPIETPVMSKNLNDAIKKTIQNTTTKPEIKTENKVDIFDMFQINEFDFPIKIKSKLPPIDVLKMMYNSSENKDEFLNIITNKLIKSINEDSLKDSIKNLITQ